MGGLKNQELFTNPLVTGFLASMTYTHILKNYNSRSAVLSLRYQAMVPTIAWVIFPPKQPNRSMSMVCTPSIAAARAAAYHQHICFR
jgi:hypothetical protein